MFGELKSISSLPPPTARQEPPFARSLQTLVNVPRGTGLPQLRAPALTGVQCLRNELDRRALSERDVQAGEEG